MLQALLNTILNDEKGAVTMEDWMAPHALDLVCKNIHREMDATKPLLKMSVGEITPEFLSKWDINTVMRPAELATPTLTRCIKAATESRKLQDSTKGSKSRNRETVRNFETYHFYLSLVYLKGRHLLHAQLHYYRSFHSCKCQIVLGLFFWSCGCSKDAMNVLHHAGLSLSYASIATMVTTLADRSIEEARLVGSGPHALTYDNINLSTSIFVEQGPNMASKVQSGTFAVIYELCNAKAENVKIEPLIHNLTNASLLELSDLRLSHAARTSYFQQMLINIMKILF